MRTKTFVLMCCAAIPLAFEAGCGRGSVPPQESHAEKESAGVSLPAEAVRSSGIRLEKVGRRPLVMTVRAAGTVTLNKQKYACVSTRFPAIVERVDAFEGDRVREGQSLAALYSADYLATQQDLIQLLRQADRDDRGTDADASAMTGRLVRSATAKLKLMGAGDADIQKIRETMSPQDLLILRAPFSGTIISASVPAGHQLAAGADLFEIADLDTLWVIANLNEKDISYVRPGSTATVTVPAWPGETFSGRLSLIGDIEDETTRTVKTRIEIGNPQRKLKPGMYAEVTLTAPAEKQILAVPESAVRDVEARQVVFQPGPNGTFVPRSVKTGRHADGWVEIIEGLQEGDEIVTEGSFSLKAELLKKTLEGEE
jgi:membrane fusion protein, copper/silver efflux system